MKQLILFTTDGCHLCEQAIGMFFYAKQQQLIDDDVELKMEDIVNDTSLTQRYGERIPVIRSLSTEQELGWPFELDDMVTWIKKNCA